MKGPWEDKDIGIRQLTVSSCCSPIFLPASLLIQSSPPLEFPSLDMRPGTTRGILCVEYARNVRVRNMFDCGIVVVVVWV